MQRSGSSGDLTSSRTPEADLGDFFRASLPANATRSGAATVTGTERDGDIIIRPDGKKVRVVKKIIKRTKSSDGHDATSLPATFTGATNLTENYDNSDHDHDHSNSNNNSNCNNNNNNLVEGDIITRPDGKKVRRVIKSKTSNATEASEESVTVISTVTRDDGTTEITEIVDRADGKKVRRVRRVKSTDSLSLMVPPTSPQRITSQDKLEQFLISQSPTTQTHRGGAATVAGTPTTGKAIEGDVYINQDGKKVRRVIRRVKSNELDPLDPLRQSSETPVPSSAATTTTTSSDIYVRPDGKKVRRTIKRTSSMKGPGLGGFFEHDDEPTDKTPTNSGAATVAGALPSAANTEERVVKVLDDGAEIVVRPDGKKVIRRQRGIARSQSAIENLPDDAPRPSELSGFLRQSAPPPRAVGSAATVSGGTANRELGEIYINKDGKKVRRVRKTGGDNLQNFLGNNPAPRESGAATVAGNSPAKAPVAHGEIYIRADGKKVRRVRKSAANSNALGNHIGGDDGAKRPVGGAATVAGDQIVKETPEGTIIIRNGKKILRRRKQPTATTGASSKEEGEVYRRADGKLVRRVKRSAVTKTDKENGAQNPTASNIVLSTEEEEKATPYRKMLKMGLPKGAVQHKMSQDGVSSKIIAAVLGLEPPPEASPENDKKKATPHTESSSTVEETTSKGAVPDQKLDETTDEPTDDELTISAYKKMLKMGLPEGALRHKMEQDGVSATIVSAVFATDSSAASDAVKDASAFSVPLAEASAHTQTSNSVNNTSSPQDELVEKYKKMLKMGLPMGAVQNKMVQDGVDESIMAAVIASDEPIKPSIVEASQSETKKVGPIVTQEESEIIEKYRKMTKVGLPPPAIEHKMTQDGVDPKLTAIVLSGDEFTVEAATASAENAAAIPPASLPSDSVHSQTVDSASVPPPKAVSYVVTVGDDPASLKKPLPPSTFETSSVSALISPGEHFAVNVQSHEDQSDSTKAHGQMKYMTLEELAKVSGQSVESLQKAVSDKRSRGLSPPRFQLQPLQQTQFAVELPPPGTPASVGPTTPGGHVAPIKEGQEVVDSDLAMAARAVSALGDTDMQKLLEKLQSGDMGALLEKLKEAEKRQKKLEKQLAQSGIAIAEDIDYREALRKVDEIAKRMNEIGGSDVELADKEEQKRLREEYFKLEQEMERYNTALTLTDEYQAEQERREREWETSNEAANIKALKQLRRHMPVKIRHMSEAELTNTPTPNGKFLPKVIAKKFKRTNVLQCLRLNPDDIERMHPSTLENMRVTGLTLTERRALYEHLKPVAKKWEKNKAEKMTERKWTWYQMMKNNFKENLAPYQRHIDQYGPAENHVGCPLIGKQCPIKADKIIDYDNDYGFTDKAEYEISEVKKADVEDSGAKAMLEALELVREKKANERAEILKKHYKGKLLQVSKANGSCEAMDECMDKFEFATTKWCEFILNKGEGETEDDKKKEASNFMEALNEFKLSLLDFAQRSGMQTSGARKKGGGGEDIRSSVECSLSEEVYEAATEFFTFIRKRLKEIGSVDTRLTKTVELLEGMLSELHERNIEQFKKLGIKRSDRSRKLKKNDDFMREAEKKKKEAEAAEQAEAAGEDEATPGLTPAHPMAGRGGGNPLMDAIKGRGGGNPLMDAIKGRGGGNPLMDAIKSGRGRGGRGGLLDAIKSGRGGRGGDGGRGGLLDAIKGRGAGGRGGRGDAGGRGGLLAAIAARGGGGD